MKPAVIHMPLFAAIWMLTSCASYDIPSLAVTLDPPKGTFDTGVTSPGRRGSRKIDITPLMPYLMRATWCNVRQPFTVWKVWTEVELVNGRHLLINTNGWGFRVSGVDGEYYIRRNDMQKFEAAYRKLFNQPK